MFDHEIDYGKVFGMEPAQPEGEEAAEVAEPLADTGTEEGAEVTEAAEPSDDMSDAPGTETGDGENGQQQKGQSQQENARFAAARRKAEAERDAAVAKAKQDAQAAQQKAVDDAIRACGLVDPYSGKPITNKAEFDAYKARSDEEKKKRIQKKSGMTDSEFEQFVNELPEVRAAKQARQEAEDAQRQAREQAARGRLEEDLKQITKLDPAVKSMEDLVKSDNYQQIYDLVRKGYGLLDAYRVTNFDRLQQSAAAAAQQQARNAMNGKNHLTPTAARGTGAVQVPPDVAAMYRVFDPSATDAEIQKHYAKNIKK